jgi:hypothetical protein
VKPPRGKRVDPQSRSAEFSVARGPGLSLFGILWEPTVAPSRAPPRALSADREPQPVWWRSHAGKGCRWERSRSYQPSPASRCRTEEPPHASRPPSLPGEFDWERLGNRVSRPLIRDWRGAGRASILGWWQVCRQSIRPVLKHGPRSLTCARVIGSYETQRRSESEGPSKGPGGILPSSSCEQSCVLEGWRTTGPSRLRRQWGGARACTLGPERW